MGLKEVNVYSHDDFNYLITYYNQNSYKISFINDDMVFIEKKDYGNLKMHMIILLLSGWFSFGILNIFYILYSYIYKSHSLKIIYHHHNSRSKGSYKHHISGSRNIKDFLISNDKDKTSKKIKHSRKHVSTIIDFLEDED